MKNKLQIRSFVKGGNHGQYLQAFGLFEFLKSEFPDLEISHLNYNNHILKEIKIQIISGHFPKYLAMLYFWYKRFKFTSINYSPDISIYGSDMIWHQESELFPSDPIFFGKQDNSRIKISYAPSVASRTKEEANWISEYLEKFEHISVRDENTSKFVFEHVRKDSKYVIDPCFLLINTQYNDLIYSKNKSNFISIYSTMPKIVKEAFLKNLNLKETPDYCNSFEVLGYFERSKFFKEFFKQLKDPLFTVKKISESKLLITSTFHGIMMALMTKTPFIAINTPNLEARLQSPISNCFGSFRLITINDLENMNEKNLEKYLIDNDLNQEKLNEYIMQSKKWIKHVLNDSFTMKD